MKIFWSSDPVFPGEVALLVGDGLSSKSITVCNDEEDDIGISVEPLQASSESVKFVIPAQLKKGVYRVTVSNRYVSPLSNSLFWNAYKNNPLTTITDGATTFLRPISPSDTVTSILNSPSVYWTQGDKGTFATPGGSVRAFGRCIGGYENRCGLRIIKDKTTWELVGENASNWDARFYIPNDLSDGLYTLQINNGLCKKWYSAGALEVKRVSEWSEKIFSVRSYGAKGTGTTDDTIAILAAVKAAGDQGGGIVFFDRGRYLLSQALVLPRFVTLRGERRDLVNLLWQDFVDPPKALIQGSNNFALEDLTLYASRYGHLIAGDLQATSAGEPGNVRIQRVTARADIYRGNLKPEDIDQRLRDRIWRFGLGNGESIRLGGENLVVTDNDIYGSARSLYLFQPRGAYIARNHFYNGRWGWYCLSGVDGLIFEDNQITGADLMSAGGGINNLGGTFYSKNVFFARNKISLLHGLDREAMTTDAGGGFYYGSIKDATANTFMFATDLIPTSGLKGVGVFILGGKGMGQFAQISNLEGGVVTLDRPWSVIPDASSVVTVTGMQQNYMFVDNEFTDAGVALQYYGTSINHIAAGNKSTRTAGFYNSGRWYAGGYQPSWYCQFLDNEILEGNVYRGGANNAINSGEAFLGTLGLQKPPNTAPLALGSIHRRNHLYSNAHLEIMGNGNRSAPGARDVIIENNIVENSEVGLKMDNGVIGVISNKNIFKNVSVPFTQESGPELIIL